MKKKTKKSKFTLKDATHYVIFAYLDNLDIPCAYHHATAIQEEIKRAKKFSHDTNK